MNMLTASAVTLMSLAIIANAADSEAQGIGILSNPERLEQLTGFDLNSLELLGQRIILRQEGTHITLHERQDGTLSWQIFEDQGEEGVRLSVGAEQNEKVASEMQLFALLAPKSACGGPNEQILAERETYPYWLTYCRKHGSSNPRRGKRVINTKPGNNDPKHVVATYELLCDNANDSGEMMSIDDVWFKVCAQ